MRAKVFSLQILVAQVDTVRHHWAIFRIHPFVLGVPHSLKMPKNVGYREKSLLDQLF